MSETASVVVRSKDRESTIEAALRSLRDQSVEVEIVLVDSGSRDTTVARAAPLVDEVVRIAAEEFTFGGALNLGVEHSSGSVVFALSSHCVAHDPDWVRNSLAHYADPDVAGTCGWTRDPTGLLMPGARPITFQDVHHDPHAGFSNHASSWRRSVWEDNRFDERLPACEDLDWMWRVMMSGWKVVADPALVVDSGHRRTAGASALWRREYIEHRTVAELVEFPVMGATDVVRIWWNSFPWPSPHPRWLRRMGVGRNVELMAGYLGDKAGQARRDARTLTVPSETPERRCAP